MSEETNNETTTKVDETAETSDETVKTEEKAQGVDNKIPYDRFKAKVDEANALKEKLAEIETAQAEEERKQLEEQEKYKELYEQEKERNLEIAAEVLDAKKDALLTQAGYSGEQIGLLRKLVEGDSDEEIKGSIELLKNTFPTENEATDPSAMNGRRDKYKSNDGEGFGKSLYERVMGK